MAANVPLQVAVGVASGGTGAPPATLGAPLKLVIWDLDETLWRGTLSEGEVELDPDRAEIVRELNRRGIVSSVCSKNDPEYARACLERHELWDQFVFPSIGWTPKGARIAQIVRDMQLRPVNVLFVDDNVGNLQEALHYVPGLQIGEPGLLATLLSRPQAAGKADPTLERLERYRVLERKLADREQAEVSNEDFLRSCEIRVELAEVGAGDVARVLDLVNRSNQLNFTKSRLTAEQLRAMLADGARETRCVRVHDRYGDYGLCGFYSLAGERITDYVFSCRILHMGVEQWLYARLGEPALEIVGDVASGLEDCESVNWIAASEGREEAPAPRGRESSRVLLKGGCDLFLLNGFLGGSIKTEFTYPSETGAEVHGENTEVLRRSSRAALSEHGEVIDRLPFLDRAAYASRIVRKPRSLGTVILSVLMDYTQGLYRLRDCEDFVVPYGQYDLDATDPANWPALEQRWGRVGIDTPFLEWFAERFEYQGALSPERFQDNVRWLSQMLPRGARLVLINGAEVPLENPREPHRHLRHREMNQALEQVVTELPDAAICDVRRFVTSPADLKDNLRHYTRPSYLRMAQELKGIVGEDLGIEQRPLVMRMHRARRKLARNFERAAVRLQLR